MEDQNKIVEVALTFFQRLFSKQENNKDFNMLNELPPVVNEDQNDEFNRIPEIQEVKKVVMGLSRNSTGGPDSMTRAFFRKLGIL